MKVKTIHNLLTADEWNGVTGQCSRFGVRSMTVKFREKMTNLVVKDTDHLPEVQRPNVLRLHLNACQKFRFQARAMAIWLRIGSRTSCVNVSKMALLGPAICSR